MKLHFAPFFAVELEGFEKSEVFVLAPTTLLELGSVAILVVGVVAVARVMRLVIATLGS